MTQQSAIKIFEESQVRTLWDSEQEEWYFSIIDVVHVLTSQPSYQSARNYWKVLKHRLAEEGNETVTNCNQLKMPATDGKMRKTDVATQEQLFRLIQSIPSPKAEPFKQWMAQIASQRLDQMQDPELSIEQALIDYKRLGYSDEWISERLENIRTRKALTDEWKARGVKEGVQYAILTDIITKEWSGLKTKEYKQLKGLKKQNLRDNMSDVELALNRVAEVASTAISKKRKPETFGQNKQVAQEGGKVAKAARLQLEEITGESAISPLNANHLQGGQDAIELP